LPGHGPIKFLELLEEIPRKIAIPREDFRIPPVGPPAGIAINLVGAVGREHANFILATEIALPTVKRPFVSPGHPPRHPALRTPRGRRDFDFLVEGKILRLNNEVLFAILADSGFGISHIFQNKLSKVQHQALLWCYNSGSITKFCLQFWQILVSEFIIKMI
jgi:hypothetical protein